MKRYGDNAAVGRRMTEVSKRAPQRETYWDRSPKGRKKAAKDAALMVGGVGAGLGAAQGMIATAGGVGVAERSNVLNGHKPFTFGQKAGAIATGGALGGGFKGLTWGAGGALAGAIIGRRRTRQTGSPKVATSKGFDMIEVNKASRYYDADAKRRHQMGMAEGATAVSGAALAGYGGLRASRQTRNFNHPGMRFGTHDKVNYKDVPGRIADEAKRLNNDSARGRGVPKGKPYQNGRSRIDAKVPRNLIADRKAIAALAGGGALLETARRVNNRARSDKHRTWS